MSRRRWTAHWPLALLLALVASVYWPGFGGFWLSDDFGNLHKLYMFDQRQRLLQGTLEFFGSGLSAEGSFYRPLSIVSLSLNYALAGMHYGGWHAVNLLVHLANVVLVFLLVRRLADLPGREGRNAAVLAAALFGLAPSLAEGVFWVSARADAWVTLLCLAGTLAWLGRNGQSHGGGWWLLPMFVAALLFKESAAVLPLQLTLLALALPAASIDRKRRSMVIAAFAILALFLGARLYLFGNPWQVYAAPNTPAAGPDLDALLAAIRSLAPWWQSLLQRTPYLSIAYPALLALAVLLAACAARAPQRRMAIALVCASGGMVLATMLNLGSMPAGGEGGRLSYTPMAWLAIGFGVAAAGARSSRGLHALVGGTGFAAAAIGAVALLGVATAARDAQAQVRAMTEEMPLWAGKHAGLSLLIVPARIGPVVALINAQGGLVLRPVQTDGLLHRVLPTLIDEVAARHAQLAAGLATQLGATQPHIVDATILRGLLEPAPASWPAHYACWSVERSRILSMPPPRISDAVVWSEDLARASRAVCGL